MSKLNLKEIIFEINSTVSQEMTGSANDRFLMRSVRAFLPNSIDPQLDPKELINRRISNHEGRIKNKNQNNKVFYKVGSRVRLQDVKSKLFSTLGTVLEQRTTDSGDIVSYIIKTDRGHVTTRHRKFMRQLEPENDPQIKNNFTNLDKPAADRDILENVATEPKATDRSDSGYDSREEIVERRSGRIKARKSLNMVSKVRVTKVSIASESLLRMGQSCSSELEAEKAKNKQLEGRIRLYEQGITDKSIHASQTNFGLLTIANEDNSSGCNCQSQSLWGVLEVIAVMLACILLLYILYSCLVRYFTRRKTIRERRQRQLLTEVEARMGRAKADNMIKPNLAIEMAPSAPECGRVHVPDYQTEHSRSKSTQQNQTFDH